LYRAHKYKIFIFPLCEGMHLTNVIIHIEINLTTSYCNLIISLPRPVAYRGGGELGGFKPPSPEILKALQNCAKLNPIVKTVKNC